MAAAGLHQKETISKLIMWIHVDATYIQQTIFLVWCSLWCRRVWPERWTEISWL